MRSKSKPPSKDKNNEAKIQATQYNILIENELNAIAKLPPELSDRALL